MVNVKETYILEVQAKALRHRLAISEDAWFLEISSLGSRAVERQLAASADAHLRNPAESNQP